MELSWGLNTIPQTHNYLTFEKYLENTHKRKATLPRKGAVRTGLYTCGGCKLGPNVLTGRKLDSKWIANFSVSPQVLAFLEKREYVSEYQHRYGLSELSFVAREIKLDNKYFYFILWN